MVLFRNVATFLRGAPGSPLLLPTLTKKLEEMRVVFERGDSAEVRELVCALQKVGVRLDIVDEGSQGRFAEPVQPGADDAWMEVLTARLKPLFYGDEANVRQFLKEIRDMADQDITDLVNRWVEQRRISDYGNSRKGMLWKILYEAGLYKRTKQNWNHRVT